MTNIITKSQVSEGGALPRAYTFRGFAKAYGISVMTAYRELNAGRLATYLIGSRRFVSAQAAEAWFNACQQPKAAAE
jgi:DNA-binding transcriptional regulator YhcF (GntR family)